MKKKVFSLALVVCCLSVFIASSTLAYFTKEDTATNVITTGNIDIDLVEVMVNTETGEKELVAQGPNQNPGSEFEMDGVMPGQEVVKIVSVVNEQHAEEAWVRIKVTKAIELKDGTEGDANLLEIEFNEDDWTKPEGSEWYYYNDALKAGKDTKPLMSCVVLSEDADNKYQESKATIYVVAQAVQTKNNGSSALDAAGWPET